MKFLFFIVLSLTLWCSTLVSADTKILHKINIVDGDNVRDEIISLRNSNSPDAELVIEGVLKQTLQAAAAQGLDVYNLETIYVADKNGYRAKYKLVKGEGAVITLQLSPSSLKTLAG